MSVNVVAEKEKTTPFLKWAGGKRWLAPLLADLMASRRGRHVEPFVGSGACFFQSPDTEAILADSNCELINAYRVVKQHPQKIANRLSQLDINKVTFLHLRSTQHKCNILRAARFIYLNRTAFNGLYRVNSNGVFNVPFGCKKSTQLPSKDTIYKCSEKLKKSHLFGTDFKKTLQMVGPGDRVYLDPPYTVKHNNNGFRQYNENLFSWQNQLELSKIAHQLVRCNIRVIISNAFYPEILRLYNNGLFHIFAISRVSGMANSANARGLCKEALLISKNALSDNTRLRVLMKKHLYSNWVTLSRF